MRCAVARASNGYLSYKINNTHIYIYIKPSSHVLHQSLCHFPNQCTSTPLPPLQLHHPTTLTLTCRCIVPYRGIQASNLLYMIWHCAPLYDEGANFPLWQSPEREPRFCFPLQNGNGWTLQCQTTVGAVGLFNAKQP